MHHALAALLMDSVSVFLDVLERELVLTRWEEGGAGTLVSSVANCWS